MGERVNGIHEVRGSIPLASMVCGQAAAERNVAVKIGEPGRNPTCFKDFAGIAQLVEHNLAKVGVAGSSPVSRSRKTADRLRPTGY